jgi:branched-chain amino acid transport system substrate-binding protein
MHRSARIAGRFITATSVALGLAALTSGAATAVAKSTSSKPPFIIAEIGAQTGAQAAFTVPIQNGEQTYIDAWNKTHSIGGRKIKIITLDDQNTVTQAQIQYPQAQAAGAILLSTSDNSTVAAPMLTFAQTNRIPELALGLPDSNVEPPQPYLYSTSASAVGTAISQINFIDEMLKKGHSTTKTSIGLIGYSSPYVSTLSGAWTQGAAQKGWTVVANVSVSQTATSATVQALQLAASHPKAIVAALTDSLATLVVPELRADGYTGPIINFSSGSAESTFQTLADPHFYALRQWLLPGASAATATLVKQAKASGHPLGDGQEFTAGYVRGQVIVAALSLCGPKCTGPKLNTAMEKLGKMKTGGLNANVKLSPARHRLIGSMTLWVWSASKHKSIQAGPAISWGEPG